jgi:phosphatidylserine/phosphatidylglycerophosphate/cardiolipin synthase-like enzyme
MAVLPAVSRTTLLALAEALESGRLDGPNDGIGLRRQVPSHEYGDVAACLETLSRSGFTGTQTAVLMRALAEERARGQGAADRVRLVWTGPEARSSASRDTSVVMREMFESAERSVMVAGFAVHRGRMVLGSLAQRMEARPELQVRLFLNVHRRHGSSASEAELLREFGETFVRHHWPAGRLPEVYYDPRSLAPEAAARASLHAKCVVVDDRVAFVTSANLTEAAQQRNIEAGVLVDDETFARSLRGQFDSLFDSGGLRRLPL